MEAFVVGQKYVRQVHGFGVRNETCIFIPSFQINISQHGAVCRTPKHFPTAVAEIAANELIQREDVQDIHGEEWMNLLNRTIDEANAHAFTEVTISTKLLERIKDLAQVEISEIAHLFSN